QDAPLTEPLLPLFPLSLVLFPSTNLLLHIFEERYKEMIQDCLQNQWEFGVLLVQNGSFENIGCTASISEVLHRYPDGRMNILVRGQRRFEISMLDQEKSYLRGKPQFFEDEETEPPGEESRQQAIQLYHRLTELLKSPDRPRREPLPTFSDQQLSFQLMAQLPSDLGGKQRLLELRSERERLDRVIRYMRQLIDFLERAPGQRDPAGMA
ncbi:MAG: LON peptidase substrate-binding domain-containing protein, partial [Acidobacteria bacterium]|nr:LON peptidase substrate-binding domain-containing protein [Acidobacteriota bacterium]